MEDLKTRNIVWQINVLIKVFISTYLPTNSTLIQSLDIVDNTAILYPSIKGKIASIWAKLFNFKASYLL